MITVIFCYRRCFCRARDITISEGDEYAPIVSSTSLTTISNGTPASSSNSFLRGDPEAKIIFHIFSFLSHMKQNHLYQSYQRNSLSTNKRNIIFSKQNNTSLLKHDYIPVIEKALYSKFKRKERSIYTSSFVISLSYYFTFCETIFRMKVYHQ